MREKSWNELPESNFNREAELYATERGKMYAHYTSTFNFKGFGRQIYAMPYGEALAIYGICRKTGDKVTAVQTLKAFRPQLTLKEAMDIVTYLHDNFVAL